VENITSYVSELEIKTYITT